MSTDDHEKRIHRLETQLWGTDDNPDRGIVARVMMTESIALELKGYAQKIVWLLMAALLLAIVNLVLNKHTVPAPNQSTSVITSDAAQAIGSLPTTSRRDYLLVSEVATREGKAERTIIEWIEAGRIQPAPTKNGKEWRISAEYRIPPQLAASSGNSEAAAQP
jgi:hypothetical protein